MTPFDFHRAALQRGYRLASLTALVSGRWNAALRCSKARHSVVHSAETAEAAMQGAIAKSDEVYNEQPKPGERRPPSTYRPRSRPVVEVPSDLNELFD